MFMIAAGRGCSFEVRSFEFSSKECITSLTLPGCPLFCCFFPNFEKQTSKGGGCNYCFFLLLSQPILFEYTLQSVLLSPNTTSKGVFTNFWKNGFRKNNPFQLRLRQVHCVTLNINIILCRKQERWSTGRITTAQISIGQNYLGQFRWLVEIIFATVQITTS